MDVAYYRMLFDYNAWATARILRRVIELSEAEYFAPHPGLSYASLHGTLVHILGGEVRWLARWRGDPPRPRLTETDLPTLSSLQDRWHQVESEQGAFLAGLSDADLIRPIAYGGPPGRETHQPLGYVMAHTVNHGTQFRAEAAVALTALGRSPGDLDLSVYLRDQKG